MTFRPFTSPELTRMRAQRRNGWSMKRIADYAGRDLAQVDTALWMMMGRWHRIAEARERMNRIMARREAEAHLAPMFEVAA